MINKSNKLFELKKDEKNGFKLYIDYKTFYYLTLYKYKLDSFQNIITKQLYQQKYTASEKYTDYIKLLIEDLNFIKNNNIDGIIVNNKSEETEVVLCLNYLIDESFQKLFENVKNNFQKRKTNPGGAEILIDLIPGLNNDQKREFYIKNNNIKIKYNNDNENENENFKNF